MAMIKCPECGEEISDKAKKCIHCGKVLVEEIVPTKVCSECGKEVSIDAVECPYCGCPLEIEKPKKKPKKMPIIIAAIVVGIIIVTVAVLKGPSVDEIALSKESVEIKVDDSTTVSYTITPDKAADKKVKWKSSNESVATVNDEGKITGKGEGTCTITAKVGGKSDTVSVTVKTGPDFMAIYNEYCESDWASVGYDGSYLSIDTNPNNKDDYTDYDAYLAIYSINDALGLPQSLIEDMGSTTALMGRQSQDFESQGVTVSWSYHPDNGMEVTYKALD